ncbi:hypothetical protein AXF42_Ash019834 [Apostasia shenzhenica]|uniref:Uncharacterized protein n=1 Tax=Apostasia shenzhenica TaxID=1088818 RepID=A0A2I0ARF9_9ASPA|nr:hypothetical protein AXF42_Ash019834 [Apostasia shenzhenica]
MAAAATRPLAAMEVPISTGDPIHWIELTVPSPDHPPPRDSALTGVPVTHRNASSCHVISGDPSAYLLWRIHDNRPNVLEVVELFPCNEYPDSGLHLVFHEALLPFAFLCKNESAGGDAYLLYALTVSGNAYLLNLKRPFNYVAGSLFPQNELIEFSVQGSALSGKITSVTATSGCLVVGMQDGSIVCYQLGVLDPDKPGFMYELREDAGMGRLWNFMSRGKVAGAVQDMETSEVCGRKLLFVLHSDGNLRIWDLVNHARVLSHNMTSIELSGTTPSRLRVGSSSNDANRITLAILHVSDVDVIAVYNFGINVGEKNILSPEPLLKTIVLDKGKFIDMKIGSSNLWILKEDESLFYELSDYDNRMEQASSYGLQEDFVADQLFQSSQLTLDDLIWTNNSIFSSMKDQGANFISSIFLRRLLQPGVYHSAALRAILLDRKKYLSDIEFQSLSVAGVKKEISKVVHGEESTVSSCSMVFYWKDFCSRFFQYWCENSVPYGLFTDSSNNVLGLIRKNSFSLFRSLEGIEKLIYGSSDEFHDLKSYGLTLTNENVNSELLYEVLRCVSHINHQIGRAASAIFYESLLLPLISCEDVTFHLLKMLETGYSPFSSALSVQVGFDCTWEKMQSKHKSLRKFSVDMLLSLHALRTKTANWTGVIDAIGKYLEYLKPHKSSQRSKVAGNCSINSIFLVHASSQVARVMFESVFDVFLLLGYLINASGQVSMMQADVTRIKINLIPMALEILTQWLVLHFLGTTPTTPVVDDFTSRLSSLHIDATAEKRVWDGKLGSLGFKLACLLDLPSCFEDDQDYLKSFLNPEKLIQSVWMFCSLVVWGGADEESSSSPTIELTSHLLRHGQFESAENLFLIIDAYSIKRKNFPSSWLADVDLSRRFHLLGFCLIMRAHGEVRGVQKMQKIHEAIRCFFRAASSPEACHSLRNLSFETGFLYTGESGPTALWRLHYYQWAMQVFDQYGFSEGACQFALAALEQVDEILGQKDGNMVDDFLPEPVLTMRGRLWANVFKFALDLKNYRDAYCAIISNPDEDSKYICLRRFIIVLCEDNATKVLCDGKLPFVGMTDKVEQELFWKAERSEIFARPNLYKLLYSFEAYRNNWRRAACYMYRYAIRLKSEVNIDDTRLLSKALKERLEVLSTAINALQLVNQASAWIDSKFVSNFPIDQCFPNKRARNEPAEKSALSVDLKSGRMQCNVDLEMLEKEYVLTSAQSLLAHITGNQKLSNLVTLLIKENFYDMAFTVILKFWKGSALLKEIEQAFIVISEKCLNSGIGPSPVERNGNTHFLLQSPEDIAHADERANSVSVIDQIKGCGHWETLEKYLGRYCKLHPRLPVVVAETLLYGDPQIELPLWLLNMFKGGRRATQWGMTGQQPDPATLFRLYVNYGRLAEATNLLLEYLESFATMRPADAINRKKMSAIWFPYTAIERLWSQLEELRSSGYMVEQYDKLKRLLHGALLNHLKLVKVDSEDVMASAAGQGD